MLDIFFKGIFDTEFTSIISISDFLLCIGCSLLLGIVITFCYMYKTHYTKSFATTLALLPAVVCVVIMMVNGNVGAGVAVAGAFSLVRFRSAPGSAKEICIIFLAMTTGLITGMGYLGFACLFTCILCFMYLLYTYLDLGKANEKYRTLQITIPENLNYTEVFEDIFSTFTTSYELCQVKTTNMGSLFRLTYSLTLKSVKHEKEMIDHLRCRNGNLEISLSKQETMQAEL